MLHFTAWKLRFPGRKGLHFFKIFLKAKEDILNYRCYKMALKIPWSLHIFRSLCLKLSASLKVWGFLANLIKTLNEFQHVISYCYIWYIKPRIF